MLPFSVFFGVIGLYSLLLTLVHLVVKYRFTSSDFVTTKTAFVQVLNTYAFKARISCSLVLSAADQVQLEKEDGWDIMIANHSKA